MNRPPDEFQYIPVEQLRALSTSCLKAAGMPEVHAQQLAHLLSNSDLRGVRSQVRAPCMDTVGQFAREGLIPIQT